MKFVVVTGMSGAGKTQAMRKLEDIGYFCVDNLPISMLTSFMDMCQNDKDTDKVAIVIDSRAGIKLKNAYDMLMAYREKGYEFELVFMDASDASLVRRFKATHRAHPIKGCTLDEGIVKERKMLTELKEIASHIVDTTNLNTNQLNAIIEQMYGNKTAEDKLLIFVNSFGFKRGIPLDADMVFDVRFLPNPYWVEELKNFSGKDERIQKYVLDEPSTQVFLDKLYELVDMIAGLNKKGGKDQLKIAIGCTGGMHRSVAVAELLSKQLKEEGYNVLLSHRDILKDGTTQI